MLLSPIDWAMIEGWQDRGIPLHIVIRAIESVFDGYDKNPGPRSIKGLLYCREEVEAQFLEWTSMQAGKAQRIRTGRRNFLSNGSSSISIQRSLCWKNRRTRIFGKISNAHSVRLKELIANHSNDPEAVDKALSDIESFLEHALLTRTDRERLTEFQKEMEAQLRPYKTEMEPETYDQTLRVMLIKRLREEEGIPRLSLFYL